MFRLSFISISLFLISCGGSGSGASSGGDSLSQVVTDKTEGSSISDNQLVGDDQDNILNAGDGIDYMVGGYGSDTYVFNLGDGSVAITEFDEDLGVPFPTFGLNDAVGTSTDILLFGENIRIEDLVPSRDDSDLVFRVHDTSDQIRIKYARFDDSTAIEFLEFQDGLKIDLQRISFETDRVHLNNWLSGSSQSDILYGYGLDDILSGLEGDDFLYGGEGDDLLFGGDGMDEIAGGSHDDQLFGGAGIDSLDGEDGIDYLSGGDEVSSDGADAEGDQLTGGTGLDMLEGNAGHDTLYGNNGSDFLSGGSGQDSVYGGEDNDYLIGGEGDDYLAGGIGKDTYIFSGNFGQDIIFEEVGRTAADQLILSGYRFNDLWFERVADDLVISVIGTDNSIVVESYEKVNVSSDEQSSAVSEIEKVFTNRFPSAVMTFQVETLDASSLESVIDVMDDYDKPGTVDDVPQQVQNAIAAGVTTISG